MSRVATLAYLVLAVALDLSAQPAAKTPTLAGVWEGSSLCTVPNSPCHDEHVIYHIKATGSNDRTKYAIDANKLVNGVEESMGTLECTYASVKTELYCDTFGDWRFTGTQNSMVGTLTLKNGPYTGRSILRRSSHLT